jgi:DNA-binding response OmpR family regulator
LDLQSPLTPEPLLAFALLKQGVPAMEPRPPGHRDTNLNVLTLKAILVVDDDQQLASALQWILADENFLVDIAFDGEEALLKIKAHEYDAIICDLMMPKLRGDQLYLEARKLRPPLADHFIFITGFAANPNVNRFLLENEVKYLVKPFAVDGLINCVKQLLLS